MQRIITKAGSPKYRRSSESLLTPQSMGGVLARKGMRFQDLWLLHNLVSWIVDPLFHGFVNEGREDVDTFRYRDEDRKVLVTERWQLKDRLVTKALLAEVLAGFFEQHRERLAQRQNPVSQFHLIAPAADKDVWTLPEMIDRVRRARAAYDVDALEYSASLEDLSRRLTKLGIRAEGSFVSERVELNFRAGWAEVGSYYWTTLQALLQSLGVAVDRARDAANHLFVIVTARIGELVEREALLADLRTFQITPTRIRRSAAGIKRGKRVSRQASALPPVAGSQCLLSYFSDEATLLQFADGTCGLIDCGPTAIRHIVPYLATRGIGTLSFLALTHWHFAQFGGVSALLNAVSRIETIYLNFDGNPNARIPQRAERDGRLLLGRPLIGPGGKRLVDELRQRARRDKTTVRFCAGLQRIHASGRDSDSDSFYGFFPEVAEYRNVKDMHDLSSVFLVRVAGRQLLIGGHALMRRWQYVLETARAADLRISADAFLLPRYAQQRSLTPQLIKALVNPNGFIGLLPVSEWIPQRFGKSLTSQDVLNDLRASGGRIVVCGGREPSHFAINREGVFQALSPAQAQVHTLS